MDLEPFHASARRMADAVRAMPPGSRFFLHCDSDADGIATAAVVATALRWGGHRFQVRASREKTQSTYEEIFATDAAAYMVLDKGTSHVDLLGQKAAESGRPVFVIDHHNIVSDVPENVVLLNPRAEGLDGGRDACSSTSALAFAHAWHGDRAWHLAGPALVGAVGDWQHMGGWQGWNKAIITAGLDASTLEERPQPRYIGIDLAEAITRWPEPHLPGLTGDAAGVQAFLADLKLEGIGDVEAIDPESKTTLISGLVLHGLAEGVAASELERIVHHSLHSHRLGSGVRHAFRIVDACGREGDVATGLAFLLGDKTGRERAERHFESYRHTLETEVGRLRTEGTRPMRACQVFHVANPAYTGMVGGLGITHAAPDKSLPMVVHAPRPDGDVQVSTRGDEGMVERGLDLGAACREAGLHVGREGGGHPIAAGVVVNPGDLDAFLVALDAALVGQAFLPGA